VSDAKFTPAPWRRGSLESYNAADGRPHRYVYRGDNESTRTRICVEGGVGENGKVFDCDADAALIAAAPDLYAAVRDLLYMVSNADSEIIDKARAALAKARGDK
jgi:hypothetical protein